MNNDHTQTRASSRSASAALCVSAVVLAGLIMVQTGGWITQPATAEMVSRSGEFVMMTTNGGNDEILLIIDDRNEDLLVYRYNQQRGMVLQARESLPQLFTNARSRIRMGP